MTDLQTDVRTLTSRLLTKRRNDLTIRIDLQKDVRTLQSRLTYKQT